MYFMDTCSLLPVAIVMAQFFMIVHFSGSYEFVRNANNYSCWCLPTLGNVLPLAISTDSVSIQNILSLHHTYKYIHCLSM